MRGGSGGKLSGMGGGNSGSGPGGGDSDGGGAAAMAAAGSAGDKLASAAKDPGSQGGGDAPPGQIVGGAGAGSPGGGSAGGGGSGGAGGGDGSGGAAAPASGAPAPTGGGMPFGMGGPGAGALGPGSAQDITPLPTVAGNLSFPSASSASPGSPSSPSATNSPALAAAQAFPSAPNSAASVSVRTETAPDGKLLVFFTSGLRIDADGSGGWSVQAAGNATDNTALKLKGQSSLNPGTFPYIAIPLRLAQQTGVGLGDYAAVNFHNKIVYALVGDYSKNSVLGEASLVVAKSLDINPDPQTGGVGAGVRYAIIANSHDQTPPSDPKKVESRAAALFSGTNLAAK